MTRPFCRLSGFCGVLCALLAAGCIQTRNEVEIKPIEIKPMQISIDLNVKVDKELDSALGSAAPAGSDSTANAKSRLFAAMRQRRDAMKALYAGGTVGENNRGYLEARGESLADADRTLMEAANRDRAELYRLIAGEQNTTADFVGTRHAARVAGRAAAGTWIQDSAGVWTRKAK